MASGYLAGGGPRPPRRKGRCEPDPVELTETRSRQVLKMRLPPADWPHDTPPSCVDQAELQDWTEATYTPLEVAGWAFCLESHRAVCRVERACGRCCRTDAEFAHLIMCDGPSHDRAEDDAGGVAAG